MIHRSDWSFVAHWPHSMNVALRLPVNCHVCVLSLAFYLHVLVRFLQGFFFFQLTGPAQSWHTFSFVQCTQSPKDQNTCTEQSSSYNQFGNNLATLTDCHQDVRPRGASVYSTRNRDGAASELYSQLLFMAWMTGAHTFAGRPIGRNIRLGPLETVVDDGGSHPLSVCCCCV